MRVVVATTTGFHLRRLAVGLNSLGVDVRYYSYMPRYRISREGIGRAWSSSLFIPLLPTSAFSLFRHFKGLQVRSVERMWEKTDNLLAEMLPPCDVFVGLSAMAVKSATKAKKKYGAKVIIERGNRHVLSQDELLKRDGGPGVSAKYIERELASYDVADYVTVLSKHSFDSFIERGYAEDRVFVNPLGVDLASFKPTLRPPGKAKLLFVGAWSYRKGVDILAEAVRRKDGWRLTHVGSVLDIDFPRHDRIMSVGHKNHAELRKIMSEHHVLVLPSREDGFGMVLLEGLASGLSVVATTMTGAPDIRNMISNKSSVYLASPGCVEDLIRAIEMAVDDDSRNVGIRNKLDEADRAEVGWDGYARRYQRFIQSVVSP